VYEKLADLDKQMAAEVTNAANIVTNGRTQLDNTKSWVDSAVSSLPSSLSSQARENSLIPIAKEGITQVNNTVSTANGDMLKIGFRVTDIKNQYDELQNQKLGPGEKDEKADGKKEDKGKQAADDFAAAKDGTATPEQLTRLKEAASLTPEQKEALAQGNPTTIPQEQYDYLKSLT
ncbi:TPR repeat region-containing protein, partial [Streptomyces edwardsiae]